MRVQERFEGQVSSQDDMGWAMSLVGPPATTGSRFTEQSPLPHLPTLSECCLTLHSFL